MRGMRYTSVSRSYHFQNSEAWHTTISEVLAVTTDAGQTTIYLRQGSSHLIEKALPETFISGDSYDTKACRPNLPR